MYTFFVKRLIYFVYVYLLICYCLSIWGGASNLHVHKILVLKKIAMRALFVSSSLTHKQPWACRGSLLLFPELFNVSLSIFAYRKYTGNINASLFENGGYILIVIAFKT